MRVPASMIFLGAIALVCIAVPIGLVVVSSQSKHVLVRDDYYRDGLKLDEYRAREAAFDSLGFLLSARAKKNGIEVLAYSDTGASPAGERVAARERLRQLVLTLEMRRPENSSLDRTIPLPLISVTPVAWGADIEPLQRGRWNLRAIFSDSEGKPVLEKTFAFDAM